MNTPATSISVKNWSAGVGYRL